MPKYKVPFKATVWVYVTVEADSVDDAVDNASDTVYINSYVGNGGPGKLIGVSDENMSIEACEDLTPEPDDVELIS